MAFGIDVDTLNLTFDKLHYIFNGYDQIRDSFIETNTMYKDGKVSDTGFFDSIHQSIMRFSALEFLAIKAIFEIKKSLDRNSVNARAEADPEKAAVSRSSVPSHSIASFISDKSLPRPNQTGTRQETKNCSNCGSQINARSKFCTNCGRKT